MIKSMLKNDIDITKIAKVSDKSIEEIKEIEKSMKQISISFIHIVMLLRSYFK